jgi:hypothetical protein
VKRLTMMALAAGGLLTLCVAVSAGEPGDLQVGRIPWQSEIPREVGVWSGRLNPLVEPELYKCGYWHGMYQFYTGRPSQGEVYHYCPERMGCPRW